MSAAASIASIYSALSNNAGSFKTQATQLVSEAQAIVTGTPSFSPDKIIFTDPLRKEPDTSSVPKPPVLDTEHYIIPPLPPFVTLASINNYCTAILNQPNLPGKVFDPDAISLDYTLEQFDGDFNHPESEPDFSLVGSDQEPQAPTLTKPQAFSAEPISGTPPTTPTPAFDIFNEKIIPRYIEGLGFSADQIAKMHNWFYAYTQQLSSGDTRLFDHLSGVLQQLKWAVPAEEWHDANYQKGAQIAQFENYQSIVALDKAPSSISGLPSGDRVYEQLKITNTTTQKKIDSLAKADQSLREKEFEILKFALGNAEQLVALALSLKVQQLVWTQKAINVFMEGGYAVADAAFDVIALKEKEVELKAQYNDFQLKRANTSLDIEKTKIESLRIALESEKLKSEYNQNNINAYQVAIELIEQRVRKFQLESEYSLVIKNIELLKIEVLKTEVEKYAANSSLFKLKQDLLNAKTKEDKMFIDAEMDIYSSKLLDIRKKANNLKVGIHNEMIQAKQLQQDADVYNAKIGGIIKEFEYISQTSDLAAKAIAAGSKAERLEPQLRVMKQQLEDQKTLQEKIFEVKDKKFNAVIDLKKHQLIVEKTKAQAQATAQAAGVAGGIATHAFAGLNAVGTDVLQEFA